MSSKELKILHYQNRISQLKKNPVENFVSYSVLNFRGVKNPS